MSALPPALRPWASQLSLFPDELALHLGPYVARLSAAVGALRPRSETDGGEPQGYDGLSRRGTYERLLISEWLWALEAPDELVRRAAFGELSFLKPAFRQPQGARRTVALLDAGPDQLGAPRIAHLALLIVLSRRAEAAGAAFSWAVLQADPSKGAFSEVTEAALNTWLSARDLQPPTDERLAAWREALSLDAGPEDAWLVGDARLARLPKASGLSRVEVSEVLAVGARQLTVDVRPASRPARSVVLELPPPDTSVRLLRDPFQKPRIAPPADRPVNLTAPLRTFAFSADGKRLMLYREDGSVGAMAIPHSVRATVPKARRVTPPPGQTLMGAGWRHNGGLIVLTRRGGEYVLHGKVRGLVSDKRESEVFHFEKASVDVEPPVKGAPPGRLLSCHDANGNERLLLAGVDDSLYLVEQDRTSRRISLFRVASGVTAAAEVGRKVVYMTRPTSPSPGTESTGGWLCVVEKDCVRHLPLGTEDSRAYFGFMGGPAHPDAGLLAVRHQRGLWRLFGTGDTKDVSLPTDMRVVGVGTCREAPNDAGVLALDADRRTLWLVSPQARYRLMVSWEEVVYAEASHGMPVLGWVLKGGGLVLSNLREGGILYQALPGAAG
ncbi:hypothetical protein JY651_44605 [Pyxidicoccus parkwayensis]|uniref:Lipoprotein LpqB beta-propeller domain-containing protein n=1 Tax=Pyxidicoccus parkwayensis TaxID=2813578 RepID=A0ABX7NXL8_9BACT|nr:hypothetical protein [Pyxidicoccus parkwaysis]QSQ22144.1 hypothetical protein JY651_44605 [Pyxidicoccus parkwaysis]